MINKDKNLTWNEHISQYIPIRIPVYKHSLTNQGLEADTDKIDIIFTLALSGHNSNYNDSLVWPTMCHNLANSRVVLLQYYQNVKLQFSMEVDTFV